MEKKLFAYLTIISFTLATSLSASESACAPSASNADLESLQQQLHETTRELHKYKAQLFRSTHPEDKAKIGELSQRLAQQKAINEQLNLALQSLEKELLLIRKQVTTFEVTADALSAMVQKQRIAADARENEHRTQVQVLQQQIQKDGQLIPSLYQQLQTASELITAYEVQGKEWEKNYLDTATMNHQLIAFAQDLEDALTDAAMLKFALADLQKSFDLSNLENGLNLSKALFNSEIIIESLYAQVQTLEQEVSEQKKQNTLRQTALDIALANQEQYRQEAAKLHIDLDSSLNDLSSLKQNLSQQQEQLQVAEMNMQQLNSTSFLKLTELEDKVNTLEAKKMELQQNLDLMTSTQSDKEERFKFLEQTVQDLQSRLHEKEQIAMNAEQLLATNQELQQSLNQAVAQNFMSEQRISSLSEHLEQLTGIQQERLSREQELEQKLHDFSNIAEEQSLSLGETHRRLEKSHEFAQLLREENDRLKEHLTRIIAKHQETKQWALPGLTQWESPKAMTRLHIAER